MFQVVDSSQLPIAANTETSLADLLLEATYRDNFAFVILDPRGMSDISNLNSPALSPELLSFRRTVDFPPYLLLGLRSST